MIPNSEIPSAPQDTSALIKAALDLACGPTLGRSDWVRTGFTDLDRLTGGLAPGTLTVVAGRPGAGATVFARSVAAHLLENHPPAGVLTVAPTGESLSTALGYVGTIAKVPVQKLRAGQINHLDDMHVRAAAQQLAERGNIAIADLRDSAIDSIHRQASAMSDLGDRPQLIIVEHVDHILESDHRRARELEMSGILRDLKQLALDLHIPVLALLTVGRTADERNPPRPQVTDLTASAAVERLADMVLLIYRPEYYLGDETPIELQGMVEIAIAMLKDGNPCSTIVGFRKQENRMVNIPLPRPTG